MTASTAKIDQRASVGIALLVRLGCHQVCGMYQVLACDQSERRCARSVNYRASASSIGRVGGWYATICGVMKVFAVIGVHHPKIGTTKVQRLFEHCVKDRREITRRRIDDLQNLGGCGLLL